jgi:dUTPase
MSDKLQTKIKLLSDKAKVPARANPGDAGYDIAFIGVEKIEGDVIFFKTGVAVSPPTGYYFEIVPRSSISKLPLQLANSVGIIDEGYRGEILIPIRVMHPEMGTGDQRMIKPSGIVNIFGAKPPTMNGVADIIIAKKPTLCQLILRKRLESDFVTVQSLDETIRGDGGFGSTDGKPSELAMRVTEAFTKAAQEAVQELKDKGVEPVGEPVTESTTEKKTRKGSFSRVDKE